MSGSKYISDLITSQDVFMPKRINIIDAPVSSGKTRFALNVIPEWAGTPEKVLYLIDTTTGDMSIQRNLITIGRPKYAFYDYNSKLVWGDDETVDRMPVFTYAGLGAEVLRNTGNFHLFSGFSYIICDEMQNLVKYSGYGKGNNRLLIGAETALRMILAETNTKIVSISATPEKIRERFKGFCYEVPFDRKDIVRLDTSSTIEFSCDIREILQQHCHETGILYTTAIEDMKKYIEYAREIGMRADGFWSVHAEKPMSKEQRLLMDYVLKNEAIPKDLDLLVINDSSETCIKMKEGKKKIDFMIINDSDSDTVAQVRGRYHGTLPVLYVHKKASIAPVITEMPEKFLETRLYTEQQKEVADYFKIPKPRAKPGTYYTFRKIKEILEKVGYQIEYKQDSTKNGKRYYVIHPPIPE